MDIIGKTCDYARERMKDFDGGHDWFHVERVRGLAKKINLVEKIADPLLLDIACILHDVNDSKFMEKREDNNTDLKTFLWSIGLESSCERLMEVIANLSFSNKNKSGNLSDPILLIMQDADRLDAIGAIGIARAFSYGGFRKNPLYKPSGSEGGDTGTTVYHFYEKLLKLKGMMNTETGRRIAEERHNVLEGFLKQFYHEWNEDLQLKSS